MRVNMWKARAVVAAAILLAGCSAPSGNGNESKPSSTSSSSSSEETSTASDCPELKEGETIDILTRMGLADAVRAKALPPRRFEFKDADGCRFVRDQPIRQAPA